MLLVATLVEVNDKKNQYNVNWIIRYNPYGVSYLDIGHTHRTSVNSNNDPVGPDVY